MCRRFRVRGGEIPESEPFSMDGSGAFTLAVIESTGKSYA